MLPALSFTVTGALAEKPKTYSQIPKLVWHSGGTSWKDRLGLREKW